MSKEKTFEERARHEIQNEMPLVFVQDAEKEIIDFARQEILKVIGSFEMEEGKLEITNSLGINEKVDGYNIAVKENNSRVKKRRKEYEL